MRLGLQNLLQDKLRLALSVIGIALAVMLMLFLLGMRQGVFEGAQAYLNNMHGSLVILPPGVKNSIANFGQYLPSTTADAAAGQPGVAGVTPVLQTRAMPDLHGRKEPVLVIGYDPRLGGGPWKLSEGRAPATEGEAVIDRTLARRHDVRIGDTFGLGGRTLKVVGLSDETSSLSGSYIFAPLPFVESLTLSPGARSMVLVSPAAGTSTRELAERLQGSLPGTNVLTKSEVMESDREFLAGAFDQILMMMVAAAFIVGALVVGMVLYTATIERRSEYGILKAIGARAGLLYRVVMWQAIVAAGLGVLVGIAMAFVAGLLVETWRPQFLVSIQTSAIAITLAAGFIMALIGALLPARSVVRLAPAEVFRR